jgi:CheY-like chemotaxis protein
MAGTVLIVDDSPTIRKMVSRTLQEYDYHVVEASDGPAALACVAEEPPGLVLLDVSMPGLDGYEVCRAIRGNPAHAALPIVFLTSRDGLFEKRRGRRLGANEYLVKPVHPQILIQVVAKYCRVP